MEKGDRIDYEWVWEALDEHNDVIDLWHNMHLTPEPKTLYDDLDHWDLCLNRRYWRWDGDLVEDGNAYVEDGKFQDSTFSCGNKIPKRFIEELKEA